MTQTFTRPLLVMTATAAAVIGVLRRRQARERAEQLWREATSDASS